jgi:hypothetical protein
MPAQINNHQSLISNVHSHSPQLKQIKHSQMLIQLDHHTLIIKVINQNHNHFILYNHFTYEQLPPSLKVVFVSIEEFYK